MSIRFQLSSELDNWNNWEGINLAVSQSISLKENHTDEFRFPNFNLDSFGKFHHEKSLPNIAGNVACEKENSKKLNNLSNTTNSSSTSTSI